MKSHSLFQMIAHRWLVAVACMAAVGAAIASTSVPSDAPPGAWPHGADAVVGVHLNREAYARVGLGDVRVNHALDWLSPRRANSAYRFAAIAGRLERGQTEFPLPLLATSAADRFGILSQVRIALPPGALVWNAQIKGGKQATALSIDVDPGDPERLRVRDEAGNSWFALTHPHRWHDDALDRTTLRNMDLRLHRDAAIRLGKRSLTDTALGGVDIWVDDDAIARAVGVSAAPKGSPQCNPQVWPSAATPADVALTSVDFITALRCRDCDGVGSAGAVVIAPAAELRNVGAADVAWYPKLSGNFPPYDNDQHPFLVWNIYRLDADGGLRQIGASGVKHAFFATNSGCACSPGLVLYRGCGDTYSAFTNDSLDDIGPRREVLPAPALWARCGSIYDANCDALFDDGSGASDDYEYRLLAREADLLPALNPGARWFMEAWYVVRDDTNRDNSVAFREVSPQRTGTAWSFATTGPERSGAVVDAWVAPATRSPLVASNLAVSPDGTFSLAMRARRIDGGRYRYSYVLTNIDTARAVTAGASPNLRLLSESGLALLRLARAPGVDLENVSFNDGDDIVGNDWRLVVAAGEVRWDALDNDATERWGRSYTFEFTSGAAPVPGFAAILRGDPAGQMTNALVATLLPLDTSGDRLLSDDFEGGL